MLEMEDARAPEGGQLVVLGHVGQVLETLPAIDVGGNRQIGLVAGADEDERGRFEGPEPEADPDQQSAQQAEGAEEQNQAHAAGTKAGAGPGGFLAPPDRPAALGLAGNSVSPGMRS